ncbi:MAG: cystathionine gamma-synthase [Pseudomonadota bacterium]
MSNDNLIHRIGRKAESAERPRAETIATNAAVGEACNVRSVAPPLCLSATYAWDDPDDKPAFDYSRSGNPTRRQLEETLSALEEGAGAVVTASGMAAVNLPTNLVKPGELIIAPHDLYGGSYRLLSHRAARGDFELVFVDQTDPVALDAAFARKPKLVYIETPSNPLLRVTDVKDVVARAKAVDAITVADNTFLSPALQKPLTLGCDIVVHSTTKYINGHSDVVGGAVIAKDPALAEELAWWGNCTGVTGSPFDSYLTLRGVRTLFTRIERQQATAGKIAEILAADPRVERVYYPGLKDHPGHEIAARQQSGFGAMLSVDFAEGIDACSFLRSLNIFTIAESLGGFESLVCCPAAMTHAAMPPEARAEAGISDRLVRLSIGLEHEEDLAADIKYALSAAQQDEPVASGPSRKRVTSPAVDKVAAI